MYKFFAPNEGLKDSNHENIYGIVARNNIRSQAITVGTQAVVLPTASLTDRISLIIANSSTGGQVVYIGNPGVTVAQGFPIYPRGSITIACEDKCYVYAIADGAGGEVRIIEGA